MVLRNKEVHVSELGLNLHGNKSTILNALDYHTKYNNFMKGAAGSPSFHRSQDKSQIF
jgi:hypothetical protein